MCSALQPPLIPVLPCFHLHCSPPGMCSSMTIVMTNLTNISVFAFSITFFFPLYIPPPYPLSLYRSPLLIVYTNEWRKGSYLLSCSVSEWKELSLLCFMWCGEQLWTYLCYLDSPLQERNSRAGWRVESGLAVTSAAVTLASCPHVSSWTCVSLPTEHFQSQQPWLIMAFFTGDLHDLITELRWLKWCNWLALMTFSLFSSPGELHWSVQCDVL